MLSHIVFRRGVVSVSVSVYVVIAARSFGVVILGRLDNFILFLFFVAGGFFIFFLNFFFAADERCVVIFGTV